MKSTNPYTDTKASIIKYIEDTFKQLAWYKELNVPLPSLNDFDSLGDETELPANDLYGLGDYSMINETNIYTVTFDVVISTVQDLNNFRLRELTNEFFNKFRPTTIIPMVDAINGLSIGTITIQNGTNALPLVLTKIRSYQNIMVTALVGLQSGQAGS